MKKSTKHTNPTPSETRSAFAMWKAGGKSIWDVKKETGFSARVLLPLFEKMLGKKIKGPGVRLPAKGKKEEPQGARRAA